MVTSDVTLIALADLSRDARTLNLARAIAESGLTVTVVAANTVENNEPFNVIPWSDPGGRLLHRWFSFREFVKSLRLNTRVVIAMDLFALSQAKSAAGSCGAPLLYDMREFYFALGSLANSPLKQWVVELHEKWLLRSVPTVFVSGPLDAEVVRAHYRLKKKPVVVLNTPPYRERVESNSLRIRCGVGTGTTLALYQGVLHHGRGLAPFMEAMLQLPDVHLAVLGDGPASTDLKQLAENHNVAERVHWLGSVPYDELHELTCGADFGLCLIEPLSRSYELALPNKLFEYMMARIPSLVSNLPAMRDHIDRHPCGLLVDPQLSPVSIVKAVEQLNNPSIRKSLVDACEDVRDLSYENQSRSIVGIIREQLR